MLRSQLLHRIGGPKTTVAHLSFPPSPSFRTLTTSPRPGLSKATPSSIPRPANRSIRRISLPSVPSRAFSVRYPATAFLTRLVLSSVLGVGVVLGAILFHDAFTYSERHVDRVPANPMSLHPRTGGEKNLPIVEVNLDDEEDDQKRAMKGKPRLVIIGGGWGVSPISCWTIWSEMSQ